MTLKGHLDGNSFQRGRCTGCDLGNTACIDHVCGICRNTANVHSVHCLSCLHGIGLCRSTADVRPVGTIGRRLPLIAGCGSIRRQRDLVARCNSSISGDIARRRSDRQTVREEQQTLGDILLQIVGVCFPAVCLLISDHMVAGAIGFTVVRNGEMLRIDHVLGPADIIHLRRISDTRALGIQVRFHAFQVALMLVVDLVDPLHETLMLAQKLEPGCTGNAVDVPANGGFFIGMVHADIGVRTTSQSSVQIPDRTGNQLVFGIHGSLAEEFAAGADVHILINLMEQIHLCPGIQIDVVQIIVRIAVLQCIPNHADRILYIIDCKAICHFFYCEFGGIQGELIGVRSIIDLHQITVIRSLIIVLRCKQVIAQILTVHPNVNTFGRQTDAQLFCNVISYLIAQAGGVFCIGQNTPAFAFHTGNKR